MYEMSEHFHAACAGLTEAELNKMLPMNKPKWKCITCKPKKESPRPKQAVTDESTSTATKTLNASALSDIPSSMVNLDTQVFIEYFENKLLALREEWRKDMSEILHPVQNYIQKLSDRLEGWENRLETLETKVNNYTELQNENQELKKELIELNKKFDTIDRNSRQCNVEVQNIPETNGEDLQGIIHKIGKLIGVEIPQESVRSVHRVAPGGGARHDQPRHIVLQLSTRRLRDAVLSAARVRRNLSTEQLALNAQTRRFYINEHLQEECISSCQNPIFTDQRSGT